MIRVDRSSVEAPQRLVEEWPDELQRAVRYEAEGRLRLAHPDRELLTIDPDDTICVLINKVLTVLKVKYVSAH